MTSEITTLYCENHPGRETALRCNRCNKPICSKCAISTPTGYRCPECVRGHQKSFDTTQWYDYPAAFSIAFVLSLLGGQLVKYLGFFTLLLAPAAGVAIAEAVRFAIRKRRSKRIYQLAAIGTALGSGIPLFGYLITFLAILSQGNLGGIGFFLPMIWQGVYLFIVVSTMYYRLSGIKL